MPEELPEELQVGCLEEWRAAVCPAGLRAEESRAGSPEACRVVWPVAFLAESLAA